MPAILKGWFDRVWARGVAFELPPGGGAITPALVNIKKFLVITTYGSPWWLIKLVPSSRERTRLLRPVQPLGPARR
jgi:NAD(P)H dehydrogenase (quinone)